MIEIDFGPAGGGLLSFRDLDKVEEYIEQQSGIWTQDPMFQKMSGRTEPASQQIRRITGGWTTALQMLRSLRAQHGGNSAAIVTQLCTQLSAAGPVARSSAEGEAIALIARDIGMEAAAGAVLFQLAPLTEPVLSTMPKGRQIGALEFWARLNGVSRASASNHRAAMKRLVEEHEQRVAAHARQLEDAEAEHRQRLDDYSRIFTERTEAFDTSRATAERDIAADRMRWASEWAGLEHLFTEQLKLKAAVSQWTERADHHDKAYKRQRWWAVGLGIAGLIGAVFWSWAALSLARWLFSDALVAGELATKAGTLRATWRQEIIFAASAALLYVTLFLWMMRIVVRSMMTENHLGIDARSRASMAHTYLALIETGAASEADRAIVLASLFRPVSDGLVKDDALPTFSPATLLSGQLAGGASPGR